MTGHPKHIVRATIERHTTPPDWYRNAVIGNMSLDVFLHVAECEVPGDVLLVSCSQPSSDGTMEVTICVWQVGTVIFRANRFDQKLCASMRQIMFYQRRLEYIKLRKLFPHLWALADDPCNG